MRAIRIIARRELKALFDQPTAYILLVVFTGMNSYLFFGQADLYGVASLRPMLDFLPWLLLFLVPAVTMRALAEDSRSGTLEVVLAQPITELELLLGKYVGQLVFVLIALAITLTIPLGLALGTAPELGIVIAQYIGAGLLAAGLAAVGIWASSVTRNQITAFIVGVFVMFVLIFVGLDPLIVGLPPRLGAIAASLGVLSHFSQIDRGVIDLRDAVYFVTLAALFLVFAYFVLESRKLTAHGQSLRRLRLGTVLLAGAVVVINLFGGNIGGRLDLTPGRAYTLSPATRKVLRSLPDLVTIKLFVSSALPSEIAFLKRDVDDLLRDYRAASRGKVRLVISDPASDSAASRDARTLGIEPVQFNVVGKGELQVKQGYLGIAVRYADGVKTIPFVQETGDLEYRLTSDIRALTRRDRPAVALGEINDQVSVRTQRSFNALRDQLGQNYTVRPFQLQDSVIPPEVKVVTMAGTPDSLTSAMTARFRAFLDRGGSLLLMASGMQLSPQGPFAFSRVVGWNELLKPYGVSIASNMVYDLRSNAAVGLPAQFGQVSVQYPLWLRALSTRNSPVNADLNAVLLPWTSEVDTAKAQPGTVTPLLVTSRAGGAQETTAFISPDRPFSQDSLRSRTVALAVSASPSGTGPHGRLVVVGNADFASDRYARNSPENVVFAQNAIDWLAQDEALIGIRSKNRAPAPLVFTSAATRSAVKFGNVIGVPLLLIGLGIIRLWRRRETTRRVYRPLASAAGAAGAAGAA
ncbi:MAG TPA: Gldg family protein [Gemmatimonadales bacterium]|nr:Gldg family protein [Gemmatimonadales bacterium]